MDKSPRSCVACLPPAGMALALHRRGPAVLLAMAPGRVAAGFPSPAEDWLARRHDLNDLLVKNPPATFLWRVSGTSMIEAGIHDNDLLVVDRSVKAQHGHVVVAQVDHEFTVKTLDLKRGFKLVPANPTYPTIVPRDGQTVMICGVVLYAIRSFVGQPASVKRG